jgi:hypothetical protein
MLNVNCVPKPTNNFSINLEVNLAYLSKIMVLGRPCNLKIFSYKKLATYMDLKVDLIRMKWVSLLNVSTTTMIASCFLIVFGKLVIKSMEIVSHFHYEFVKAATNLHDACPQPSPIDTLNT